MEKIKKYSLKDLPEDQRPRERLQAYGPGSLSDAELLQILIGSGNKYRDVRELAEDIVIRYGEMHMLDGVRVEELTQIEGIGQSKATTIAAAIELGKRVYTPSNQKEYVKNPQSVADYFTKYCGNKKQEEFWIILVDTKLRAYAKECISVGTLSQSLVHPREVFKHPIRQSAHGIILVHNHPSGDPTPSREDFNITKRLEECGNMVGIQVLDHVVVGVEEYYSFKEHGYIE